MYSERVVIPVALRKRIQQDFHEGHPGICRMKALRSYVYWPKMDKDIEKNIKSCIGCAMVAKAPSIKFNPWPKTDRTWSRLQTLQIL